MSASQMVDLIPSEPNVTGKKYIFQKIKLSQNLPKGVW